MQKSVGERANDLKNVGHLDGVIIPVQARSTRSHHRVLDALDALLKTKKFNEISIPEIAGLVECSSAALYGRFKNKHSILVALHEIHRRSMLVEVEDMLNVSNWRGNTVDELTTDVATLLVDYYTTNKNLLLATLTIGEPKIYQLAAVSIRDIERRYIDVLSVLTDGVTGPAVRKNVNLAFRAVFGLLQQGLLFEDVRLDDTDNTGAKNFLEDLVIILKRVGHIS